MFNRSSAFNRFPFSRPFSILIFASATLDGVGALEARAQVTLYAAGHMDGIGTLVADAIRNIYFSSSMNGLGTLTAQGFRDRFAQSVMDGIGTLTADAGRYHIDIIEFTGNFDPGDVIIIDSKTLTITKNGQNALESFSGDIFDLNLGDNEIVWEDGETGRTVRFRITYRDKYV